MQLTWDEAGSRLYETGVEKGVLYPVNNGIYDQGFAWSGLTAVTESPSGAEPTPQYADNIKYLNLLSVEEFGGTIEAFTYPPEFSECDGTIAPEPGLNISQQPRKAFGLAYTTKVGNDVEAVSYGYKLHLVYGCLATPSERAYATINDQPEAIVFSWEFSTTPVAVPGYNPTSLITIDSTIVDPDGLANLEEILYGTVSLDPRLPLPDEVGSLIALGSAITTVTVVDPSFVAATGVITIPTVTGVRYRRADTNAIVTGTVTIGTPGAHLTITAEAAPNYILSANSNDDWTFTRTP